MIRLANTAENGWGAVREYKGLYEFADNEEDNTKMVNYDRSTGVKKRRIEASQRGSKRPRGFRQMTPMWAGYQQLMPPIPTFTPTPPMMPQYPPVRPRGMPGPCFQCGEMGHLRASCPKRQRSCPLRNNKYASSVCQDSNMVSSSGSILHVNGEHGTPSSVTCHHDPVVLCNNVHGTEPSDTDHKGVNKICKNNCCSGKFFDSNMLIVNDAPRVKGDSVGEAMSTKALTSGTDHKGVNELGGTNCCSGQNSSSEAPFGTPEGSLVPKLDSSDDPLEREELSSWELEGGDQILDVRGRLKANIDFWRDTLKPAPWILDCISNSYKLPLKFIPGPFIGKNQDSAVKNSDFVAEALSPTGV